MQDPQPNFAQVRGVSEGLEHRLTAAVREADSLDDLYTRLKTKRYPHARLRRLVLDAALGIPGRAANAPPYLHVLGARKAALSAFKTGVAARRDQRWQTWPAPARRQQKSARLHSKAVDFSALMQGQNPADGACLHGQARGNIILIWMKNAS